MMLVSKTPLERRSFTVDIADSVGDLAVTEVTASVAVRHTASGPVLTHTAKASGTGATLDVAGGTDGGLYRLDIIFTLMDGQTIERALEIHVMDLDFTLPDTGPLHSYIAPTAYLDRFGLEELVLLTSDPHVETGRVNKDRFMAALKDATAEIDAALAARYNVPVMEPPDILVSFAATLTREILHRYADAMPEHVMEAAKSARTDLRRLAATESGLPGLQPRTQQKTGAPAITGGYAQFSNGKLEDF